MPVINTTAPASDEIEVSIFGPGVGECIVFHAGLDEWYIVDSCLNPDTKQPIALEYLQQLGVDYKTQVKGIFITHFHSDHVMGIAKLIEECVSSELFFSHALAELPAFMLACMHLESTSAISTPLSKTFAEFAKCIATLKAHNRPFSRVNAGRTIFNKTNPLVRKLICLSPSNVSVEMANAKLASLNDPASKLMPGISQCTTENLNAIAIHLSLGDVSVLLGSDLEEHHGNAEVGWSAVISGGYYESNEIPKSHVFKVPHHGSITGHHDQVWSDLLESKPVSVLTTYSCQHRLKTDPLTPELPN
jgi:beta-lactamase superfamily II metal-dependent hydrolase